MSVIHHFVCKFRCRQTEVSYTVFGDLDTKRSETIVGWSPSTLVNNVILVVKIELKLNVILSYLLLPRGACFTPFVTKYFANEGKLQCNII